MRAIAETQTVVVVKDDNGPFSGKQVVLARELPPLGVQRSWMAHPVGDPNYTAIVFQSRIGMTIKGEIPPRRAGDQPEPITMKIAPEPPKLAVVKAEPELAPRGKARKAAKPKPTAPPASVPDKLARLTAAWLAEKETAEAAKTRYLEIEEVAKKRRAEYQQCCEAESAAWNALQHAMLALRPERIWAEKREA